MIVLDEERYRFLVEQSGDMISTHSLDNWFYTAVNPAFNSILGYVPEDLMGRPAFEYFHPDDAETMKQNLHPALYQNGIRTFRYRYRKKNGQYTWLESTHRSIRDEKTGKLKEIIAVSRDINIQVQMEEKNRRLARVVETASELLIFCRQDYQITYMNAAAMSGFVMTKAHINTTKIITLLSQASAAELTDVLVQCVKSRQGWQGILPLKLQRFTDRYLVLQEVLLNVEQNENYTDDDYVLIIKDITQAKKAEKKYQQQQAEIAHASRLMTVGEMASGLAHEINQPLATVLNYTQGTIRQIDSDKLTTVEKVKPVLFDIARQVQRAADIIKRLRFMVKKTPYQRGTVSLTNVCHDVLFFLQHELSDSGINIHLSLTDVSIVADRVQIEQVLINLIRNALDAYRKSEHDNKRINIETLQEDNTIFLIVTDYSTGIPKEILATLFTPYITNKKTGLGMGLSISRTIVEAHGGKLLVDTDGKSYTKFTARFLANAGNV